MDKIELKYKGLYLASTKNNYWKTIILKKETKENETGDDSGHSCETESECRDDHEKSEKNQQPEMEHYGKYYFKLSVEKPGKPEDFKGSELTFEYKDRKSEDKESSKGKIIKFDKINEEQNYTFAYNQGFIFHEPAFSEKGQIVRFRLNNGEDVYFSDWMIIKCGDKEKRKQMELILMAEAVYEKEYPLLLSVLQKYPLSVYLDENGKIKDSVDVQLELISEIVKLYSEKWPEIKKAKKYKLNTFRYVDRLEKMKGMDPSTLSFVAQNPQYLMEVKKKRGIHYNEKVYLPSKTLVTKNVIDYGIYENQYIVSFLERLKHDCANIIFRLTQMIKNMDDRIEEKIIETKIKEFEVLLKKAEEQKERAQSCFNEIEQYQKIYKEIFHGMEEGDVALKGGKPRSTAIFRQLPEYNVFKEKAFDPYFDHGINIPEKTEDLYDQDKLFTTAVSEPCTTYELYVLVKFKDYLKEIGFEEDASKSKYAGIHEKTSRFQDYSYEFVLNRGENESREVIKLYYGPSIYMLESDILGGDKKICEKEEHADPLLFRNTMYSFPREDGKEESQGIGNHYEPDYILRYECGDRIRFIFADAKHKDYDEVIKTDMPELVFKYLDSIKVVKPELRSEELRNKDVKIAGLCAIYNEHGKKYEDNPFNDYFTDNSLGANAENEPFVKMVYLNVSDEKSSEDADNNRIIVDQMMKLISEN